MAASSGSPLGTPYGAWGWFGLRLPSPKPSILRLPPLQYGDFYEYKKVICDLDGD